MFVMKCLCLPGTGCPERVLRSDATVSKLIFEKCYPNVNEMCLCGCLGQGVQKVGKKNSRRARVYGGGTDLI